MTLSYAYISISIISLILILGAFILTTSKWNSKANKALSLVIFFIFIGSFFTLFEMISSSFEGKLLFRNLSQIGLFLIPSSSYNFIMIYSKVENRFLDKMRIVNFIFAITCVVLIFSNDSHGIMRSNISFITADYGSKLSITQTIFGKVCVSLNTLMNIVAFIRLWTYKRTTSKSTRTQINLVLIGFIIPFLFTYIKTMLRGLSGLEVPSSLSFLLGLIFILIGIFKYDLMSISPLARDWVIDEIEMGMIFTSPDRQIVDVNSYAKKIFSEDMNNMKNIMDSMEVWSNALKKRQNICFEYTSDSLNPKTYNVKVHDLSKRKKSIGSVSLLTDITKEKLHQEWLENKAQKDSLTKVLNRESFELKVNKIIDSISNSNRQGSLLVFDIDRFKYINDTFGHQIGDTIIIEVVNIISSTCRDEDLVGRLGGDEFAMFIVDTNHESVKQLVHRIQDSIINYKFADGKLDTKISLSIGIHIQGLINLSFEDFYSKADQAMYKSKELGRNRASIY